MTFDSKVMCVLVRARLYATHEGKVVCDLRVQVIHEGSIFVECACGVGMELTGLDMMSSAELNTW